MELRHLREVCKYEEYATAPTPWQNREHVAPEHTLRSTEINLSKEAHDKVMENLPLRDPAPL